MALRFTMKQVISKCRLILLMTTEPATVIGRGTASYWQQMLYATDAIRKFCAGERTRSHHNVPTPNLTLARIWRLRGCLHVQLKHACVFYTHDCLTCRQPRRPVPKTRMRVACDWPKLSKTAKEFLGSFGQSHACFSCTCRQPLVHVHARHAHIRCVPKNVTFLFFDIIVRFHPILLIFGRNIPPGNLKQTHV